MCDEHTASDNEQHLLAGTLTRRRFNHLAVAATLMAMLPSVANAQAVTETEVVIPTPDGEADCYFVHPVSGSHAGVVI
ncbi:MAG: hypothetical protein WC965_13660, partial [Thiohalomonadaceae bacterium]